MTSKYKSTSPQALGEKHRTGSQKFGTKCLARFPLLADSNFAKSLGTRNFWSNTGSVLPLLRLANPVIPKSVQRNHACTCSRSAFTFVHCKNEIGNKARKSLSSHSTQPRTMNEASNRATLKQLYTTSFSSGELVKHALARCPFLPWDDALQDRKDAQTKGRRLRYCHNVPAPGRHDKKWISTASTCSLLLILGHEGLRCIQNE